MLVSAKMTSKGQLTIPAELRAHFKLEAGDRVEFQVHNDGTVVMRAINRPFEALIGCVRYDGPPMSIEQIREGIMKGATEGEGDEPDAGSANLGSKAA
jgi:AbrB family looped-hinge helix DNA binding protein